MGSSSQGFAAAWMGGEFREWIYVCVWLSVSAVHLKPSQHCSSIGYTAIQHKKLKKKKKTTSNIYLLGQKGKWRSLNRGPPASLSLLQRLTLCQPLLNHACTHWWWEGPGEGQTGEMCVHNRELSGREIPESWVATVWFRRSLTLAWKIPWTEEPGRLQSMGSRRVGHDWATSLSLFTLMHWRRKWQPIPVFLPGEFQGQGSLVGCHLWGPTESDTTEAT